MRDAEDANSIEQEVYRLLMRLFLQLDDADRRFFMEYGLSTRQFWALQYLSEEQGRSMVDLSRLLLTDKSNVTGITDRLERSGLAARTPAPNDRRVILITLTAEGRRLRDLVREKHEALLRELLDVEDSEHLHTLVDLLNPISRNLAAYLERTAGTPATVLNGARSRE